ncbi:MAG: VWA domain-containing protein [Terriglobales bacterium]
MAKIKFLFLLSVFIGFVSISGIPTEAQQDEPNIHVIVEMVQLNVAVTDKKGNYVTGLRPQDFSITEDGVPEKVATFGEGDGPTRSLIENLPPGSEVTTETTTIPGREVLAAPAAGANVFILFDTSNYMYRGFVFAQDAIADFVRSLENSDRIALYSYSRDLSRAAPLTSDRSQVLRGVRATVAGDDAALYNCLLLTVKDAAQLTGKKVVVVFSNGPDNASMVPPEDVAELAQSTGTSIYMISTRLAQLEPVSTAVFERMTKATGGKAYFAKNWKDEQRAFASIRDDLAHLYSLSYYPQANPNHGWRAITVKLVGEHAKQYHIRTRDGYRWQPQRFASGATRSSLGSVPKLAGRVGQ